MSANSPQPEQDSRKSNGMHPVMIFSVIVTIMIVVVVLLALIGPMVGTIYSGPLNAL